MAEDDTARNSPNCTLPRRESNFDSGHLHGGPLARQFSLQVSRNEGLAGALSPHFGQKVTRTVTLKNRVTLVRVRSPLAVVRQHNCIVSGAVFRTKDHRVLL